MDNRRSALIVASNNYSDPGLKRLRAPASDARALAAVLQEPAIGGFEVHTMLNEPAYGVNLAVEEFFADRRPDDLLLVHFSCHGVKDESGDLYFAMANTLLRRLGATAVAAAFVNRCMSRSRSRRVVLLLDCCYAGAFERGMTARAGEGVRIESEFGGRGRAVITASSAMEYAFEGGQLAGKEEAAPSVFTRALVEGLETGDADRDQDGEVALDELYDYVYERVRAVTPHQTPGKWAFGVQGELVIARRARPVTTPSPLPPELQEAIESPLAGVRAAAVQELARLLHGSHAGRVLAAQLALKRLTEDDSRTVAAAATAAVGSQLPQPALPPRLELSATVADFGRIAYNARSAEHRIRLINAGGGDLNARARTQLDWLRLRQEGDDLVLAVDTTAVGEHEHTVTVDSNGGSATIHVKALVGPAPKPAAPAPPAQPEPVAPRDARPGAGHDRGPATPSPPLPVAASPPEPVTLPVEPSGEPAIHLAPQRRWIAVAAAGVLLAAAAVGSYLLVGGGRETASPTVLPPPCTTQVAKATTLPNMPIQWVKAGGRPFDAVTSDGFGFVSIGKGLAVMDTTTSPPTVRQTIPLTAAQGEALTRYRGQQYLLAAGGTGITVFRVSDLERGQTRQIGSLKSPRGRYAVEVAPSPDGKFAFVTLEHSGHVAVFDLRPILEGRTSKNSFVRAIPVGHDPVGIATSTDGKYIYVAQGLHDKHDKGAGASGKGNLVVLDMHKAEMPSAWPVVRTVDAGCGPGRVLAYGKNVWVTVGGGNALIAYSATKLISDYKHALVARVALGSIPLGLVMVNNGTRIIAANSDRDKGGSHANLAVVNVPRALAHKPALVGVIKSGLTPRQFALDQGGTSLLVTNTDSHAVQAVDITHLP